MIIREWRQGAGKQTLCQTLVNKKERERNANEDKGDTTVYSEKNSIKF